MKDNGLTINSMVEARKFGQMGQNMKDNLKMVKNRGKEKYGRINFVNFRFTDGSTYEGEFYNNDINGEGRYIWTNGRVY